MPAFDSSSRAVFRQTYNRESFLFKHALHENPLFTLPSILALAGRQSTSQAHSYWSNGKAGVADGWNGGQGHRYTLTDTLANIEGNNSLVLLKHLEQDEHFGPIVKQIHETIYDLVGPEMRADVIAARGTLLIASPHRVTAYHIDSDVNYLFQIAGEKSFHVFDQNDRTLTTHEELEKYYSGDLSSAVFKEARAKSSRTYDLGQGLGVHVPCIAAHWAQNLDSPSIALSINFDLRSVMRLGRIYRLNAKLRSVGITPMPPGISAWRDDLKLTALHGLKAARRILGGGSAGFKGTNA